MGRKTKELWKDKRVCNMRSQPPAPTARPRAARANRPARASHRLVQRDPSAPAAPPSSSTQPATPPARATVFTTDIAGVETLRDRDDEVAAVLTRRALTTPALPWAWKLFPSTFSSKPPFSLYVICNDLKRTPGDIRAALPNFVAEEEADENVRNGTTPRRITVTQRAAREGQLTEAEKRFALFYNKLSNEINCGVKRALMRFIETMRTRQARGRSPSGAASLRRLSRGRSSRSART